MIWRRHQSVIGHTRLQISGVAHVRRSHWFHLAAPCFTVYFWSYGHFDAACRAWRKVKASGPQIQALRYRLTHTQTHTRRVWPALVLMSRFLNTAPRHRCFLHRSWLSQEAIGFKKGTRWQLLIMWRAHRQVGLCTCAHARAHICLLGAFSFADVPPQQADRRPPATLRHVATLSAGLLQSSRA